MYKMERKISRKQEEEKCLNLVSFTRPGHLGNKGFGGTRKMEEEFYAVVTESIYHVKVKIVRAHISRKENELVAV